MLISRKVFSTSQLKKRSFLPLSMGKTEVSEAADMADVAWEVGC